MGWGGMATFAITTAITTTVLLLLQISTETVQKDSSDILSKKKKKRLWTFWLSLVKCECCVHFFESFASPVYVRDWTLSRRH
jgi:hypothetical protein